MKSLKWWILGLAGVAALGLGLAAGGFLGSWPTGHGWLPGSAAAADPEPDSEATATSIPVKVIAPKVDPSFKITVSQPCYVEPYYRVNLEARVPGQVRKLTKAIGSEVKEGEEILTIDVPDLVADLAKKEEIIKQRQRELDVAQAMAEKARADVEIARVAIRQKESEAQGADAETDFRKQEYERFKDLASRGTTTPLVVAERLKYYEAAAAFALGARAAVDKAKADLKAAIAKVKEADADEKYREEMIEVARRDRDEAAAQLDYATLRAPFNGVITRRMVNPGSFVQSSATGRGQVLLTIERSDVVTIYMNLPDNYAPFVGRGTEAVIEMSELPGVTIQGQVSRFAPSLITDSNDRTMRVEVDLWNRSAAEYAAFVQKERAANLAGLKDCTVPLLPKFRGPAAAKAATARLLPGMYGRMTLVLQRFDNAHLIPSSAVFSQGGKSYVYLVKDDVARLVPVELQVDDGRLAKVLLIETVNHEEIKRDLHDDDDVVLSNQGELTDGQAVRPMRTDWLALRD
jgi:multidrug efflux pump subunit AcrA (membrane-fusion protein)